MIELPRAANRERNCRSRRFFSFGTNDLTQTCVGLSRDDSAGFMGDYQENDVFAKNPFAAIDQDGVGQLVEFGEVLSPCGAQLRELLPIPHSDCADGGCSGGFGGEDYVVGPRFAWNSSISMKTATCRLASTRARWKTPLPNFGFLAIPSFREQIHAATISVSVGVAGGARDQILIAVAIPIELHTKSNASNKVVIHGLSPHPTRRKASKTLEISSFSELGYPARMQ